jgi:hypothetical protein
VKCLLDKEWVNYNEPNTNEKANQVGVFNLAQKLIFLLIEKPFTKYVTLAFSLIKIQIKPIVKNNPS